MKYHFGKFNQIYLRTIENVFSTLDCTVSANTCLWVSVLNADQHGALQKCHRRFSMDTTFDAECYGHVEFDLWGHLKSREKELSKNWYKWSMLTLQAVLLSSHQHCANDVMFLLAQCCSGVASHSTSMNLFGSVSSNHMVTSWVLYFQSSAAILLVTI